MYSSKSTFFKNLKNIINPFSEEELKNYIDAIFSNIINNTQQLIRVSKKLNILPSNTVIS